MKAQALTKEKIKLVECPRDAMQGWPHFIPTDKKIQYLNELMKVGFDTIDFGSFVSPKAIPQMADTAQVLKGLDPDNSTTKLLAIIANRRGAEEAVNHERISYLGFPFSVSETFQQRNTNSSIASSFETVTDIHELCLKNDKQLVVYISMAFGNPYGDTYDAGVVIEWANKIAALGVNIISLADTVGVASSTQVSNATRYIIKALPGTEIGVHLHSGPISRRDKLQAALAAGCRRFDGAIRGIGGCPMAGDDLVGNMDTEVMAEEFTSAGFDTGIDVKQLAICNQLAAEIFV